MNTPLGVCYIVMGFATCSLGNYNSFLVLNCLGFSGNKFFFCFVGGNNTLALHCTGSAYLFNMWIFNDQCDKFDYS